MVDLVEVEVADLEGVGVELVDLGVEMVVCFAGREGEAEAGGVASQGLSRSRSRGRLFDEWP